MTLSIVGGIREIPGVWVAFGVLRDICSASGDAGFPFDNRTCRNARICANQLGAVVCERVTVSVVSLEGFLQSAIVER